MSEVDPATLKLALGEALRGLHGRLKKKYSVEALAEEAGIDRTYLGLLERGKRDPRLSMVYRLAEAFNISPGSLMRVIDSHYHRLRNEEPVSISNKELKGLIEFIDRSRIMKWLADRDKKCLYVNEQILEFTGVSREEIRGEGWIKTVHPDDLEKHLEINAKAFARRKPYTDVYRMRHGSGYAWVVQQATPYFTSKGEWIGYLGSLIPLPEEEAKLLDQNH